MQKSNLVPTKEFLTTKELLNYINMPKQTLYYLTMKKSIPHYKRGNSLYFKTSEINEWLSSNKIA